MTSIQLVRLTVGAGINLLSLAAPKRAGNLALNIFCHPPKPRLREKERKFLATADRLDFIFEGKSIAVYSWGGEPDRILPRDQDLPFILLSYGWGYNAGRWRYFVQPLLEAGYRVIAFDPPGHGYSHSGLLDYPTMVRLQKAMVYRFGAPELFLGHSFGGSCFVGALNELKLEDHPSRICLLGTFSEARWLFRSFRRGIGLSRRVYAELKHSLLRRTGESVASFDNALMGSRLGHIACLFMHDPADKTTAFSNAIRNHAYWPGSALYEAKGAGHHLSTADTTAITIDWLINGQLPLKAIISPGLSD
ncbi:MAG: alpha/beta hydrolase, partial [Bacteroidota bacterium]